MSRPIRPLIPTPVPLPDWCLAVDRVRYAGEPVAAVAAVDRATAEDALERIEVEYEPLPAVVDPEAAIAPGGPLLYPELGTNVLWHDVLDLRRRRRRLRARRRRAARALRDPALRLHAARDVRRASPSTTPALDAYTFWTNDQRPGLTLAILAECARRAAVAHAAVCPDIGGALRQQAPSGLSRSCARCSRARRGAR